MNGNAFVLWAIGLLIMSGMMLIAIVLKPKEALSRIKRKKQFVAFLILESLATFSYIIYYYI